MNHKKEVLRSLWVTVAYDLDPAPACPSEVHRLQIWPSEALVISRLMARILASAVKISIGVLLIQEPWSTGLQYGAVIKNSARAHVT